MGGKAIPNAVPINGRQIESIAENLINFFKGEIPELGKAFSVNFAEHVVGSGSRDDLSSSQTIGDLDLIVKSPISIKTVCAKLTAAGIPFRSFEAQNFISLPVISGNQVHQVDLNFVDSMEWAQFSMTQGGVRSTYKAAHRNEVFYLLAALLPFEPVFLGRSELTLAPIHTNTRLFYNLHRGCLKGCRLTYGDALTEEERRKIKMKDIPKPEGLSTLTLNPSTFLAQFFCGIMKPSLVDSFERLIRLIYRHEGLLKASIDKDLLRSELDKNFEKKELAPVDWDRVLK